MGRTFWNALMSTDPSPAESSLSYRRPASRLDRSIRSPRLSSPSMNSSRVSRLSPSLSNFVNSSRQLTSLSSRLMLIVRFRRPVLMTAR